ncbi:polysaccharide pyruvyl transferase family protein [Methylococcus capsulatus]|uniref:polysaccharide pyruvyl transferase family protein n=1 Tax=Methylococcus capsulatus TaxID=414 RepID=UPI002016DC00|nr:polysaccharide pyruvyl transferase family protein [Methylococcus capsulatus]UQN13618.1 polysaccharide pyruvyl transferase family protein [Methylococcus capsulatus]
MRLPRVLFTRLPTDTRYPFEGQLPLSDSIPRPARASLRNIETNVSLTENTGNMLIGESLSRILELNRPRSCHLNLTRLLALGWSAERIRDEIHKHFDLVVFLMANAIRKDFDLGNLADAVSALETDFMVFGIGMQDSLPPTLSTLPEGSQRLLRMFDQKALIFGVRGKETENWLHQVGLNHAKALGCPSLYVYPQNLLAVSPPSGGSNAMAIASGHLTNPSIRSQKLISLFRDADSHYIMQDEFLTIARTCKDDERLYNDATGRVRTELCRPIFERILGSRIPFKNFWYFQNLDAWRVFCAQADFYLGDRFHGGIVAMQAGIPSIFIWNDQRARELTDFFALPNISVADIGDAKAHDLVDSLLTKQAFTEFRDTYRQRLDVFVRTLGEHRIRLDIDSQYYTSKREDMRQIVYKTYRKFFRGFN